MNDHQIQRWLILREWKAATTVIATIGIVIVFGLWITSGKMIENKMSVGTLERISLPAVARGDLPAAIATVRVGDGRLVMIYDRQTWFSGCRVGQTIRFRVRRMNNGHTVYSYASGGCEDETHLSDSLAVTGKSK